MRAKFTLGIAMLLVGAALVSLPAQAFALPYRNVIRPAVASPVYAPQAYRAPAFKVPNYAYYNYAQAYRNYLIWQSNYAQAYRNYLMWQNYYGRPPLTYGGGGGGSPDCNATSGDSSGDGGGQ
jgi:hypothetical protein